MLQISNKNFKHPEVELFHDNEQFSAFPTKESHHVDYNEEQFFALGLLKVETLIDDCQDEILLAYPPSEWLAEREYMAYKSVDGRWELDEEDIDEWDFDFDAEQERFNALKAFHTKHGYLQYNPDNTVDKSSKEILVYIPKPLEDAGFRAWVGFENKA